MHAFLTILSPLFILIIFGYIIACKKVLPENTAPVLNKYIFMIGLPIELFTSMAREPIESIVSWRFVFGIILALALAYSMVFVVARYCFKENLADSAMHSMGGTFNNGAFLGIPVLHGLFPADQRVLVLGFMCVLLTVIPFVKALVKIEYYQAVISSSGMSVLPKVLFSIVKNPIIIAALLGIMWSVLHLPVPGVFSHALSMIGGTATPCALFSMGLMLNRHTPKGVSATRTWIAVLWLDTIKLVLCPLVTYVILILFQVDSTSVKVGVIMAALPAGTTVFLLAEQYHVFEHAGVKTVISGTILSIVTLPIVFSLLHVGVSS